MAYRSTRSHGREVHGAPAEAAIVGALLAGLAMAEYSEEWHLCENAHPIMEFMKPFFFVLLGAHMNLKTVAHPGVVLGAALICLLAVLSRVIGCGLGSFRLGWRPALQIGVGMVPRGEVGLIVAAVGLGLRTISDAIYGVVLLMIVGTTLFTPPVLRLLLRGQQNLQI